MKNIDSVKLTTINVVVFILPKYERNDTNMASGDIIKLGTLHMGGTK